jgi:hypothetical protein
MNLDGLGTLAVRESTREQDEPYDHKYWGENGIDIMGRWGKSGLGQGLVYIPVGAPVPDGSKGQVRKFSSGRKARHLSSDEWKPKA